MTSYERSLFRQLKCHLHLVQNITLPSHILYYKDFWFQENTGHIPGGEWPLFSLKVPKIQKNYSSISYTSILMKYKHISVKYEHLLHYYRSKLNCQIHTKSSWSTRVLEGLSEFGESDSIVDRVFFLFFSSIFWLLFFLIILEGTIVLPVCACKTSIVGVVLISPFRIVGDTSFFSWSNPNFFWSTLRNFSPEIVTIQSSDIFILLFPVAKSRQTGFRLTFVSNTFYGIFTT